MSIIWSDATGWILCHSSFLEDCFSQVNSDGICSHCGKYRIFHVDSQFMRPGQKTNGNSNELSLTETTNTDTLPEAIWVKKSLDNIVNSSKILNTGVFNRLCPLNGHNNAFAVNAAVEVYKQTEFTQSSSCDFHGCNPNPYPIVVNYENQKYLVPECCEFYNCDVEQLMSKLPASANRRKFDIVVVDPPWRNKHIRRKNATDANAGYSIARNCEFLNLPLDDLLADDGLVAVWCTNSQQQIKYLVEILFPAWNVDYIATWYWVKVTVNCEPVCKFSNCANRKQPFERIIFAARRNRCEKYRNPEPNRIIVSVPSSVHSHKPPLKNVLTDYAPIDARCIELFARYLVPGWTSCGNEVLKLQHESLFR